MNEGRYLDFGFEKMDGSEWCHLLKCGEFRRYNTSGWGESRVLLWTHFEETIRHPSGNVNQSLNVQ